MKSGADYEKFHVQGEERVDSYYPLELKLPGLQPHQDIRASIPFESLFKFIKEHQVK